MDQPWHRYYEEGVPGSLDYPNITLPELLDRSADTYPDRTALRFYVDPKLPPSRLTYRALKERALRFATALFQLGVRRGDRVGIMLPNCTEFVIAFFWALRLGAIAVNLSPLYVSREMREILVDSGCETLVLLDQFYPRLKEIHAATRLRRAIAVRLDSTLPVTTRAVAQLVQWRHGECVRLPRESHLFFFNELLLEYPASPPGADLKPGDVAVFQYTGGTTGTPKAAMFTHRNLVVNVVQTAAWFHGVERGNEVLLGAIPFFHVYGLTSVLLFGIAQAAEIVLIPRPRPVDVVLEAIQRFRVSLFPGVPTLYAAINEHPRVGEYDLRSGALCVSGAAPLPREVFERFEALTGGRLVEGYGLTETKRLTARSPGWRASQTPEGRDSDSQRLLNQLEQSNPVLKTAMELAQSFARMVRERAPDRLEAWLVEAAASGLKALRSF